MMQPSWMTKGSNGFLLAIGLILAGCGGSEGEKPAPEPAKQYAVQLSVTNLQGSLALQLNGQSSLTVSKDGTYSFDKQLTSGTSYAVTVTTQPGYQQCTVSAGTGTIQSANVTNVSVACADQVQMTELTTYYPASIVEFTVPATSTEVLSVTYNDLPLKVEQGISSSRYVYLPNNASGSSELAYSIGTLSRKKAISVQPLTLPADTKTYVETQYQTLLAGLAHERENAADPATLDALLAELKTNQSQLSALNAEQLARLTLVMMQLLDTPALSNKSFDAALSAVPEACEQFTTRFMLNFSASSIVMGASVAIVTTGAGVEKVLALAAFGIGYYKMLGMVDTLFKSGCIRAVTIGLLDKENGVAVVPEALTSSYTQTMAALLIKTGTSYGYTIKPTLGYESVIESKLKFVTTKLRAVLQIGPDALVKPLIKLLDTIDNPKINELSYQVTADAINGVSINIAVDKDQVTVTPKITDITQLTQSNYSTKLHVKASIGEQVHDIDATVVVDFKPVVQSTKLQAEIGKKTDGKVIAENVTSFTVVTQPTMGLLNFDSKTGAFDYTPNADTVGKADSFTVRGTYLLGGDPNKSYVSEVATVTIDIVPEEICSEVSHRNDVDKFGSFTIKCYYDTDRKILKIIDAYATYKPADGIWYQSFYYNSYNRFGELLEAEQSADGNYEKYFNVKLTGKVRMVIDRAYTLPSTEGSVLHSYSYIYEVDKNNKTLGVYQENWQETISNKTGEVLFIDYVSCYDRSWSADIDKSILYFRNYRDMKTGVTQYTQYDSCPKTAKETDRLRILTKDSKAKQKFHELFPDF